MIQRILAAYDGSEPAKKAFDAAVEVAERFNASLLVLAVARPSEPAEDVETEAILENAKEHFEADFASMRAKTGSLATAPRFEVKVGHPVEQIMSTAEEEEIDLILMGHRGKTFLQRWIMGSVSKQVMNYAHCAVMVVR